ncbi:VRR NUC domain containing protein [Trichuris trichiura]|uniref:Fanconi-associated nuclease n=1 Tax=Trichuris trichiura TaxID=36087 RepID=A0A077Z7H7_TRITR|nr:VRR NUC domain containing protein [Trichuris trichiura]
MIRAYTFLPQSLEKLKRYKEATDEFIWLISACDPSIMPRKRGSWYERIVLNYEHHLKKYISIIFKRHLVYATFFSKGMHTESIIWLTLFGLLCWQEIYSCDVPDVWFSKYQSEPLDIHDADLFWPRRKDHFEKKFELLTTLSAEDICERIRETWNEYKNTVSLVSWETFDTTTLIEREIFFQEVATVIGGDLLAKIFYRLAFDFRRHRSGMPDLLVWNACQRKFKVVEVKAVGDRLSMKQKHWLEYLCSRLLALTELDFRLSLDQPGVTWTDST